MQVEAIDEQNLTPQDEQRIMLALQQAFTEGFEDRSFYQQRHNKRFIVRNDDVIIGHMAVCYRSIRMNDQLVRIAGLAEVATDPDFRGQGIASKLMTVVLDYVQGTQADFFLLFGVRAMYEGNGFRAVPNAVTYVDMQGAETGSVSLLPKTYLMVQQLKDIPWDDTAHIDLLGHMF